MSPTETVETKNDAKKNDGVKREISVEIPAEEVARETETLFRSIRRWRGFPGSAPDTCPRRSSGSGFKEDLKSDVVEALVPQLLPQGSREDGLDSGVAAAGHRSAHS